MEESLMKAEKNIAESNNAISQLLHENVFADHQNAQSIFTRLITANPDRMQELLPWLIPALGGAADPDRSLVHFERLVDVFGLSLFADLQENPRLVEILVTLFSASPFLTEILLATPDAIRLVGQRSLLTERKTLDQYHSESMAAWQSKNDYIERLNALRRYQRRELLRIGVSDFLDLFDLRAVFSQLSRMAIGITRACLALASEETGVSSANFTVLAMGKLGARELNYSSDIDLLFIAKQNSDNTLKLAKSLIDIISKNTGHGFLYRVDMRLRPWGHDGPLVTTLEGYLRYYKQSALLWEKQAFLKARPIAGNLAFGEELRREVEPLLFSIPADEVRAGIFSMKQRTEEFLLEKGRKWGEVKLGAGSIRDVEFVVQSLQLTHSSIRTRSTLKAIPLLREAKLITPEEARILTDGYIFLRTIEHYLQITDYQQTYTLPSDQHSLALLARRLGFEGLGAGERFIQAYEKQSLALRTIFLKYVGNQRDEPIALTPEIAFKVQQHVARMDASYATTFSPDEISHHTRLTELLTSEKPVIVEPLILDDNRWRITIVGYDYLGVLSIICGLMYLYGLDILESQVFTYEANTSNNGDQGLKKIVDVFTVRSLKDETIHPALWKDYAEDLKTLITKIKTGRRREAQGDLVKRVGAKFLEASPEGMPLYPVEIEIDNDEDEKYTLLRISAPDTAGFLYEFSNALALSHINIVRMLVQSVGNRANDILHVTNEKGEKIVSPEKQRELRAAAVLIKHFTHLLPQSPNPESAMLHFREFLLQLFERPNWVDEFAHIERPEVLNALAKLLGVSDFLWDDFLRMQYSNLFPIVSDVDKLEKAFNRNELEKEAQKSIAKAAKWRDGLNAFKDREMFRIDMRHILGYTAEFGTFSEELTDLVEVILTEAFTHCKQELVKRHGQPKLDKGQPAEAVLLALGKCGGRELGFASDIELMLVYAGQGKTGGLKSIATSNFYEELIQSLTQAIQARQEGVFHIDLQLRPYGKAGSQAVSLDSFKKYYAPDGPAWPYERQALVKLRPIAGNDKLGELLSNLRNDYVYNGTLFDVTSMRAMREKQVRHLTAAGTFNAKFSPGALVDIEYLVQGMQINNGFKDPSLRLTNIREAMAAMNQAGYFSTEDYDRLRKAHTFMRWLIDSLRVVRGNAKDVNIPPYDSDEFAYLARRLQYGSNVERLVQDLTRYPQDVLEINQRLLPA
ncbi:MAG: glutamine synthetase adenylyltransferase [Chloroflexi bacterium HGW-Chloroflexi-5]|jgi:glutamate-ammonia-ligase adenylyltransferase|nr:MAG: glutamine synthetase adenylyltransferase [Chloroflexi bacterium HGW-Chloroflexi-5]